MHVIRLPPLVSAALGKWMLALSSLPVPCPPGFVLRLQGERRKHVRLSLFLFFIFFIFFKALTFCSVSRSVRAGS